MSGGICVLCGKQYQEHGNNAEPLARGFCCNDCNRRRVVPTRVKLSLEKKGKEQVR